MRAALAIDLGSQRTRVFAPGVLLDAPSVDPDSGRPVVAQGVVVDEEAAARLAVRLLASARRAARKRTRRVIASCPLGDDVARARLEQSLRQAGANQVDVIPSTTAAAAGAGVDVTSPYASMVVDVGAALIEVAVFRSGAILHSRTIPIGAGNLSKSPRDLARLILDLWKGCAEDVQVEIIESGLVLTGGGAAAPGLVDAIREVTRLSVRVPERPDHAVIRGLARLGLGAQVP